MKRNVFIVIKDDELFLKELITLVRFIGLSYQTNFTNESTGKRTSHQHYSDF